MSEEDLPLDVRRKRDVVGKEGRVVIPAKMRKYHEIVPEETMIQWTTIKKGKILLEVLR